MTHDVKKHYLLRIKGGISNYDSSYYNAVFRQRNYVLKLQIKNIKVICGRQYDITDTAIDRLGLVDVNTMVHGDDYELFHKDKLLALDTLKPSVWLGLGIASSLGITPKESFTAFNEIVKVRGDNALFGRLKDS